MGEVEGRDIFADDFSREEQCIIESRFPSEIQKFFEDSSILITGGTGFLGRILLEKLLRACWKLKKIYLLIRPKKGKSIEERFKEIFDEPIFDNLSKARPNFKSKIVIVSGDLADEGDILSEEDRQLLIENINVVFHCAATVRFDEKLRRAININIRATKYIVDMANEMKNLKAFIHVSTAYSNCPEKIIKEQFYPPPYNYEKIMGLLSVLEDKVLDKITPTIIGEWPNTYAFTKLIAEDVIREYGKGLPIGILRPSIVISTAKEPITGWINNYYGPQGVVFGAAVGLLRTLHCDPNVVSDVVPVDYVINAVIALAWDIGQTRGDNPNFEKVSWKEALDSNSNGEKSEAAEEIPVLNFISSERRAITWGYFMFLNYKEGRKNYSMFQIWHSSLTLNPNVYVDRVYRVVCHHIPALVVDFIAIVMRKKPILWNSYKKIHKFSEVISYFCTTQWKFKEDNVIKLWDKLSPKDKKLFYFNVEELDWESYFQYYITGIKVYLAKDTLAFQSEVKNRSFRLKIYHYALVTFVNIILLSILYCIFCVLFY